MGRPGQSETLLEESDNEQDELLSINNKNIENKSVMFSSGLNALEKNHQKLLYQKKLQETEKQYTIFEKVFPFNIQLERSNSDDNNENIYYIKKEEKKEEEKKEEVDNKTKIKKYFNIDKIPKERKNGRMSKEDKEKYKSFVPKHNKNTPDNVFRKIKTSVTSSILDFVNQIYKFEFEMLHPGKWKECWLKKIARSEIKKINKEYILKWLDMKLKDYLSSQESIKNKGFQLGYNAKAIKKIFDEGKMVNLIKILNLDMRTVLKMYVCDDDDTLCELCELSINETHISFRKLQTDFNGEEESDIEIIRKQAEEFEELFKKKRKRTKSNII